MGAPRGGSVVNTRCSVPCLRSCVDLPEPASWRAWGDRSGELPEGPGASLGTGRGPQAPALSWCSWQGLPRDCLLPSVWWCSPAPGIGLVFARVPRAGASGPFPPGVKPRALRKEEVEVRDRQAVLSPPGSHFVGLSRSLPRPLFSRCLWLILMFPRGSGHSEAGLACGGWVPLF